MKSNSVSTYLSFLKDKVQSSDDLYTSKFCHCSKLVSLELVFTNRTWVARMSRNVPGVLDRHPHAHCSHGPLSPYPTLVLPFFVLYMNGSVECVLISIMFVRFILDLACDGRELVFITDGMPQCAYTTISLFIRRLKTVWIILVWGSYKYYSTNLVVCVTQ